MDSPKFQKYLKQTELKLLQKLKVKKEYEVLLKQYILWDVKHF